MPFSTVTVSHRRPACYHIPVIDSHADTVDRCRRPKPDQRCFCIQYVMRLLVHTPLLLFSSVSLGLVTIVQALLVQRVIFINVTAASSIQSKLQQAWDEPQPLTRAIEVRSLE